MGKSLRALLAASRWERSLAQQLRNRGMRFLHLFMSLHRLLLLATGHTVSRFGMTIMACGCVTELKYVTERAHRSVSVRVGDACCDDVNAVSRAACTRAPVPPE